MSPTITDACSEAASAYAAASKAFEPDEFLEDERALPFRKQLPGMRVNNPWLQAMALDRNREFTAEERAVVAEFLELMEANPDHADAAAARSALDGFWAAAEG